MLKSELLFVAWDFTKELYTGNVKSVKFALEWNPKNVHRYHGNSDDSKPWQTIQYRVKVGFIEVYIILMILMLLNQFYVRMVLFEVRYYIDLYTKVQKRLSACLDAILTIIHSM